MCGVYYLGVRTIVSGHQPHGDAPVIMARDNMQVPYLDSTFLSTEYVHWMCLQYTVLVLIVLVKVDGLTEYNEALFIDNHSRYIICHKHFVEGG